MPACVPDFSRVKNIALDDDFIQGLPFFDVLTITHAAGVATVGTVLPHGYVVGQKVSILGANEDIFNAEAVLVLTEDGDKGFTYSIDPLAPAAATGQLFTGVQLIGQAYGYAECNINPDQFGKRAQEACDFFVAHVAAVANQDSGGSGPLSTESIGGISVSRTLPYLNRTTVLGATQFGNRYLDIIKASVVPYRVVKPRC